MLINKNGKPPLNVLILTATIAPRQGIGSTKRMDPEQREKDYLNAFIFYCNRLNYGVDYIIFGENSKSDISKFRDILKLKKIEQKVEIVSYDGLTHNPQYGKGYGEFKLVDNIMENSIIIKSLTYEDTIWKISGRYKILNFDKIIFAQPLIFDIYCNYKIHPKKWVDMYLMAWRKDAYVRYLKNQYHYFNETITFKAPEFILRKILEESSAKISYRFKIIPKVDVIAGSNDSPTLGLTGHLKYYIRILLKKFWPTLWV